MTFNVVTCDDKGGISAIPTATLVEIESLLRECAQRFGNASVGGLSEKTASEMARKCGNMLGTVEKINEFNKGAA